MEALNEQEVLKFLHHSCSDLGEETLDLVKKAKVTGRRASKWSVEDWLNMGLSYGDVIDIRNAIAGYNGDSLEWNCISTDVNLPCSSSQRSGTTSKPQSQQLHKGNPDAMELGTDMTDDHGKYDSIAQYFSLRQFQEMSDYEKDSYINAKALYDRGVVIGLQIKKPKFMEKVYPHPSSNESDQVRNTLSCNSDKESTEGTSAHTDDGIDGSNVAGSSGKLTRKRTTNKRSKAVPLSEAELVAKLPKFDIKDILDKCKKNKKDVKKVISQLESNGIVYQSERKVMIRTLTKWLYYQHVSDIKLVTMDMREGLAMSIVETYPKFKSPHPTKPSWWRILDRTGPSGFIAHCTITILRNASPSDRARGGGSKKQEGEDGEEDEESGTELEDKENEEPDKDAGWMRLTMPYANNKSRLVQGMQDSFSIRRTWIMGASPTVAGVLERYPHLMSFGGEMLDLEFGLMYPERGQEFVTKFPILLQKLKEFSKDIDVDSELKEDAINVLRVCIYIAKTLPRPNLLRHRRRQRTGQVESVSPTLDTLIQIIPIGSSVEAIARERRNIATGPVQPYLLAMVPDNQVTKLFIVADSKFIQLGNNSLHYGLDMLFKTYHIFNAEYPLGWKSFWDLIEHGVFEIEKHNIPSAANEFLISHEVFQ